MYLRPYKPCDAQTIVRWCADEDTFLKWSGGRFGAFPVAAETLDGKYRNANGDCAEPDNFYPMTAVEDGCPVGHFIIRYLNGDPKVLRFGWVIVDGQKRGRGLGRAMLSLGLKFAFEILMAEKLTIGVFENNPSAHRCYRAVGFRDVPMDTEVFDEIGGQKWKILELEMTREQYLQKC